VTVDSLRRRALSRKEIAIIERTVRIPRVIGSAMPARLSGRRGRRDRGRETGAVFNTEARRHGAGVGEKFSRRGAEAQGEGEWVREWGEGELRECANAKVRELGRGRAHGAEGMETAVLGGHFNTEAQRHGGKM